MRNCPYCEKPISVQLGQNSKSWAILTCSHCDETVVLLDPVSAMDEVAPVQKAVRTIETAYQQRVEHQALAPVTLEIRAMTEESEMEFTSAATPKAEAEIPKTAPHATVTAKTMSPDQGMSRNRIFTAVAGALVLTAVAFPLLEGRMPGNFFSDRSTDQMIISRQSAPRSDSATQTEALLDRSEDPRVAPAKVEPAQALAFYTVAVVAPSAFVRSGPGTDFPKAAALARGDTMRVIEEKDGWLRVALSNATGWIRKDLVRNN